VEEIEKIGEIEEIEEIEEIDIRWRIGMMGIGIRYWRNIICFIVRCLIG
jgi:hypothetical protein